jgi:hypothetical protein
LTALINPPVYQQSGTTSSPRNTSQNEHGKRLKQELEAASEQAHVCSADVSAQMAKRRADLKPNDKATDADE